MADARTVRTRARLHAALFEACRSRPLAELSVAEVVRVAGIARATFYLHYPDLNALAVGACAGLVTDAVDALHAGLTPTGPPPELVGLLGSIRDRAEVYRPLLGPGGTGPLGESLNRGLRDRSLAERRARVGGPADEAIAEAVAATFTGVLAGWLHGGVPGTPAELAARVWSLLVALHRSA